MSNMLPQAAALNQQVWADLENYSRSLVRSGANELYTIAGGWGSAERIANGKVNVPSVCWKIILVLPQGDNDLQRINADTRVIAVSMPNRERKRSPTPSGRSGSRVWPNWRRQPATTSCLPYPTALNARWSKRSIRDAQG
jgi:endonuclease G